MCRSPAPRMLLPAVLLWLGTAGAAAGDGGGGGGGGGTLSLLECPEVRRSPPPSASGPNLLAESWPVGVKSALGAARALWAPARTLGVGAAEAEHWGGLGRGLLDAHRPAEAVAVQTPSMRLLVYRSDSAPSACSHSLAQGGRAAHAGGQARRGGGRARLLEHARGVQPAPPAQLAGRHGARHGLQRGLRRRRHGGGRRAVQGRGARTAVAPPLLRLRHGRLAVRAQRQHPQPQQHPGRRLLQHRPGRGGPLRRHLGRAALRGPPVRPQHHRVHVHPPGPRRAAVLQVPVQLRVRAGDPGGRLASAQRLLRRTSIILVRAVPAGPAALRHGQRLGEGRPDGTQGGAGRRHGPGAAARPRRLQEEEVQDRLLQHVDDAGDAAARGAAASNGGGAALRGAQPVGVPVGALVPRDGLRHLLRLHHPQAVQDSCGVPHSEGAPLGAQGPRPAAPSGRHGAGRVRLPGSAHRRLAALLQRGLPAARHRHHGRRHGVPALQDLLVGLGHAGSRAGQPAGGAAPGLRVALFPHAVQRARLPVRRAGRRAARQQHPVRGAGPARGHAHRQPLPHHHARHALRPRAAVRHGRAVPHLPARALDGEEAARGAQPAAHPGQPEQARRRRGGGRGHRHGLPLQRRGRHRGHPQGHEPGRHPSRAEAPLHPARDTQEQEHEAQQPAHLEAPRRSEGCSQKILPPEEGEQGEGATPPPHAQLGAPPHGRGGDGGGGLAHPGGLGVLAGGALRRLQRRALHLLGVRLRLRHAQRVLQGLRQAVRAPAAPCSWFFSSFFFFHSRKKASRTRKRPLDIFETDLRSVRETDGRWDGQESLSRAVRSPTKLAVLFGHTCERALIDCCLN